ncbi:phosphate:Na+ symporter [Syntrophus gentianae]|uniref:Phosphate:Na+ symporter n=1 Tax=Syntrophus gentianae TaxID=43775 RepID=A0A1H7WRE1_9BACT|nr:Na/Pi cotransporter family protein [Syntrophus gentianae]SEM24043.1 phosphate:Na+ symporter [Syntrophus gentianae]
MLTDILTLSVGLVLFLFGMMKLSDSMQRLFTARIRGYVRFAVKRPVYGLLTGMIATMLFQSSSATTVLTIGMVSAGLISFYSSLGMILGADIGTTLTVQLVVWKFTTLSPVFVILGGGIWIFGKDSWKPIGEAIFHFGLIFFGLSLATTATAPLQHYPVFVHLFQETKNPFLGVLVGAVFTGLIHSSAIPISMLVILAQQGAMSIDNALPIVIGANIGTTATALLAGSVASLGGRRSAVSHFLFKLICVGICLAALPVFIQTLKTLSAETAQQIALSHLLFNLLLAVSFIFVLKPFSRLIEKLIPGKEETLPLWPQYLDEALLDKPREALDRVKKELEREAFLANRMLVDSMSLFDRYEPVKKQNILYVEMVVDTLRREMVQYLSKISSSNLSPQMSRRLFNYTSMVDDIERIADHAVNIVELARNRHERNIQITVEGSVELLHIRQLVEANLGDALALISRRDEECIRDITCREAQIDVEVKEARDRHLMRFHHHMAAADSGPTFVELLIQLERISDHCQNIAESIYELEEE